MIDPSRTVGYYRVSTEKQADTSDVLARYREDLLLFGVREENLYFDVESGGSATREGFNRVLEACREWADTIAIPDLSRFQRSVSIWESVRPELIHLNVKIVDIYAGRELDFRTAEGIRNTQIETAQNEYYRNYAAQGALRGQERRRRQRKPSVAPFGYLIVKDVMVINNNPYKDTGKTYREIALEYIDLFLREKKLIRTVQLFCKKYGYDRLGSGNEDFPHDRSSFRRWITNPALRGHQAYYLRTTYRRKSAFAGDPIEPRIHPDNHEPLITPDVAREIDRILSLTRRGAAPTEPVNPLVGLVFCAGCGGEMRNKSTGKVPYRYLLCSNAYPSPGKPKTCSRTSSYGVRLEHAVTATIDALVSRAAEIAEWGVEGIGEREEPPEIVALRESIERLEKIKDPDLAEVIRDKRGRLKTFIESRSSEDADRSGIVDRLSGVCGQREFWESLSVREMKELLPEFVRSVTIDRGIIVVIPRV